MGTQSWGLIRVRWGRHCRQTWRDKHESGEDYLLMENQLSIWRVQSILLFKRSVWHQYGEWLKSQISIENGQRIGRKLGSFEQDILRAWIKWMTAWWGEDWLRNEVPDRIHKVYSSLRYRELVRGRA